MTGMIVNPRQFLDQRRDTGQGPKRRLVAMRRRTSQQGSNNALGLLGRQFAFATRRPLARQGRTSSSNPRTFPSVSDLPCHAQATRDFRGRIILAEKLARFFAPLFHCCMVSCFRHHVTIYGNLLYVTLLYEIQ